MPSGKPESGKALAFMTPKKEPGTVKPLTTPRNPFEEVIELLRKAKDCFNPVLTCIKV